MAAGAIGAVLVTVVSVYLIGAADRWAGVEGTWLPQFVEDAKGGASQVIGDGSRRSLRITLAMNPTVLEPAWEAVHKCKPTSFVLAALCFGVSSCVLYFVTGEKLKGQGSDS